MTATTQNPRDPASDEAPPPRCCSAEAAVVRWALSHIEAGRFALPAVQRDDLSEVEDQG